MTSTDPHSVSILDIHYFDPYLDLITKVNSLDDLNKNRHFLLNRLRILHKLYTHYIFEIQLTRFAIG